MKTLLKLFPILLIVSACSQESQPVLVLRPCHVCCAEQKAEVLRFVSEHIADANNMSDEEMEDVILQLQETGVRLICNQTALERDGYYNVWQHEFGKDCTVFNY